MPELDNRPVFIPSAASTFAVAIGLALCAVLVAASAGLIVSKVPALWVTWLAFLLALALVARAVGDFRLVGFFKRVRGTRFARLDSALYAPLCLVLGVAVFYIAVGHPAKLCCSSVRAARTLRAAMTLAVIDAYHLSA